MTQAELVSGWGQAKPRRVISLPSGSKVVVHDMDLAELFETGILDNIDIFTQELTKEERERAASQGLSEESALNRKVMESGKLNTVLALVDSAVTKCVVDPKVHVLPEGVDPEPGKVYLSLIPMDDKFAIFDEVVPDMQDTFPDSQGSEPAVAALANGEGLPDNSVGAAKHSRSDEGISS